MLLPRKSLAANTASVIGAIISAIWAFVNGFVAGVVIAWIYNLVAR